MYARILTSFNSRFLIVVVKYMNGMHDVKISLVKKRGGTRLNFSATFLYLRNDYWE